MPRSSVFISVKTAFDIVYILINTIEISDHYSVFMSVYDKANQKNLQHSYYIHVWTINEGIDGWILKYCVYNVEPLKTSDQIFSAVYKKIFLSKRPFLYIRSYIYEWENMGKCCDKLVRK